MDDVYKLITLSDIAKQTALDYGISEDELRSKNRSRSVVEARGVAIYLAREILTCGFVQIGEYYNRDHSSIVFSYYKIQERMKNEEALRQRINDIRQSLYDT